MKCIHRILLAVATTRAVATTLAQELAADIEEIGYGRYMQPASLVARCEPTWADWFAHMVDQLLMLRSHEAGSISGSGFTSAASRLPATSPAAAPASRIVEPWRDGTNVGKSGSIQPRSCHTKVLR
jgi:hypothetical protein